MFKRIESLFHIGKRQTYWIFLAASVLLGGAVTMAFVLGRSDDARKAFANRYVESLKPDQEAQILQALKSRREPYDVFPSIVSSISFRFDKGQLEYVTHINGFDVDATGTIHVVGCLGPGNTASSRAFYASARPNAESTLATVNVQASPGSRERVLESLNTVSASGNSQLFATATTDDQELAIVAKSGDSWKSVDHVVGSTVSMTDLAVFKNDPYLIDTTTRSFYLKLNNRWVRRASKSDGSPQYLLPLPGLALPQGQSCQGLLPPPPPQLDSNIGYVIDSDGFVLFWGDPSNIFALPPSTAATTRIQTSIEVVDPSDKSSHGFTVEMASVKAALAVGNKVFLFGEPSKTDVNHARMIALEKTNGRYAQTRVEQAELLNSPGTILGAWQGANGNLFLKYRNTQQKVQALERDLASGNWRSVDVAESRRFKSEFTIDTKERLLDGSSIVWQSGPLFRPLKDLVADGTVTPTVQYRVNVITMLVGSLAVLVFGLLIFLKPVQAPIGVQPISANDVPTHAVSDLSIMDGMFRSANEQMQMTLRRSNLLLFSGIIVALIGLTLYYFSLEQFKEPPASWVSREPWSWEAWIFGRSVGMLLFIEGLAVFFFRQYRNAIADYKTFYHVRLQRENLAAAYDLLLPQSGRLADAHADRLASILLSDSRNRFLNDTEEAAGDGALLQVVETIGTLAAERLPKGLLPGALSAVPKSAKRSSAE